MTRRSLLAVGALVAIWMAIAAAPETATRSPRVSGADGPLFVGLAWQWSHDTVAMRDFGSTHGPLAQAVAWGSASFRADGDIAQAQSLIGIGFRLVSVLLLVLAWAWMPAETGQLAALIAMHLALGIPTNAAACRALAAIVLLLWIGRLSAASEDSVRWFRACGPALAWVALELFSPDYALYLLAGLIGMTVVERTWSPPIGEVVTERGRVTLRVVGLWVAMNFGLALLFAVTSRDPDPGFLKPFTRLARIVLTYSETVGRPWSLDPWRSLVVAVSAVLAATLALRGGRRSGRREQAILFGFVLLALAAFRGAMVRSDLGHIRLALIPALFLIGWIAVATPGSRRFRGLAGWAMLLFCAGWPGWSGMALLRDGFSGRAPGALDNFRGALSGPAELPALVELRAAASGQRGPVAAMPLDNRIGAILGRELVTPFHQPYAAHTLELQRRYVDELALAGPDLSVVLGIEGEGTWAFDRGQWITRSPLIFEELLSSFEAVDVRLFDGSSLLLERSDRRLVPAAVPLPAGMEHGPSTSRVSFAAPIRCPLIRLGVRLVHPISARLGWPAGIEVVAQLDGHRQARTRIVPIAGAEPFTTYLALLEPPEWPRLFSSGAVAEGVPIDEILFSKETGGPFGVEASAFDLLSLECVGGAPSVGGGGERGRTT